jgi:hypothetical protein
MAKRNYLVEGLSGAGKSSVYEELIQPWLNQTVIFLRLASKYPQRDSNPRYRRIVAATAKRR